MDGDNTAGTKGWFADYQLRVIVAFIVAPAIAPLIVIVYLIDREVPPVGVAIASFIATCVAYTGSLIVGIPLYLFLRARNWTYLWVAAALGYLVGIVAWTALFAILSFEDTLSSLQELLRNGKGLSDLVWPGGPLGFAVGVIMWLIARPDLDSTRPRRFRRIAYGPGYIRRRLRR